ncbi:MAG: hypothetical protein NT018_12480 [Armatimonadetes bacterium]|nr:hypothetical protein [Armatimonadota bacterium]
MRDSRVRLFWLMVLMLAFVTAASSLWAAGPNSIWPTYHGEMFRRGVNSNSTDIKNPASVGLIWVFPRATEEAVTDDYKYIVDNRSPIFASAGNWQKFTDPEAWGYVSANGSQENTPFSYLRTPAQSKLDDKGVPTTIKALAQWNFPTDIPKGYYQVWIWVPPGPPVIPGESPSPEFNYTKKAIYTVNDAQGSSSIVFDQTRGGTWQLLSANPFDFTGTRTLRVSLSSTTNDTLTEIADERIWVAADAIKFVQLTGQEIYSSPTSAEVDYTYKLSSGNVWSGRIPVVYVATVEQPAVRGAGAEDMGAVYCINSITPDNKSFDSDDTHKELSKLLGTPLWRYPRNFEAMTPTQVDDFLLEENSAIEGPLEGGIYSSPTLAHVGGTVNKFECLVAAMDRQVYSLDAETGKLLWKGPGITLSEDKDNTLYKAEPIDTNPTKTLRNDAFGGQFRWAECTAADPAADKQMTWDFNPFTSKTGQPLVDGWSYNVFVWIPVVKAGTEGGKTRATDANYTIYHHGGTTTIKVNQRLRVNQGRWVRLGAFFNVTRLELSSKTTDMTTGKSEKDYCVVADAAMIVPETVGPFGYSSVATDVELSVDEFPSATGKQLATRAYACTATEGRLMSFNLEDSKPSNGNIGKVDWFYPAIRTKYNITDPNNNTGGDQPSLGSVGASATYYNNVDKERVYIATLGGAIHSVNAQTGVNIASFSTPAGDIQSGFTSSVTVGKTGVSGGGVPMLFAASTSGTLYALDPETLLSKKSVGGVGAYRFSTPSCVKTPTKNYVWAASTDSSIHAFDAGDPAGANFMKNAKDIDTNFVTPKVMAAVQGSPAFDGEKIDSNGVNSMTMYVGDMDGYLSWFNAETGKSDWMYDPDNPTDPNSTNKQNYTGWQCDGALFSSPNITNFVGNAISMTYIYVGGDDGRLYAFSQDGGAWGGAWAGGYYPRFRRGGIRRGGSSTDPDDSREPPSTVVQVELYKQDFYDRSISIDPQPMRQIAVVDKVGKPTGAMRDVYLDENTNGTPWLDDWIVSPTMKKPNYPSLTPYQGTPRADEYTNHPDIVALRSKRNTEIEAYLKTEALKRRMDPYIFPSLARRTKNSNDPIYLEWGETINVVIWNLPELLFLSGGNAQSAGSSFVFKFQNTSEGESSGNLVRQTGRVTLKEYIVLSDETEKNGDGTVISDAYVPLKHGWGHTVKRCYAMAQITLDHKKNPPFSPGPGWNLVVEFPRKVNETSNSPTTQITIPLAKLSSATPPIPDVRNEEPLGINNPLSIRDDMDSIQGAYNGVGWPKITDTNPFMVDNKARNMRNDPNRHYNGNAGISDSGEYTGLMNLPFVDYQFVNHGTASRQASLGVMDASAVGTRIQNILTDGEIVYTKIESFRIESGDLHWHGGPEAIASSGGIWFPWEYGPGSIDYPNIAPSRQEYRQASNDGLPVALATSLPPVVGSITPNDLKNGQTIGSYDKSTMRPDTVFTSVDIPRFQPALISNNLSNPTLGPLPDDFNGYGYARTMTAFIDSDQDGGCDFGDTVLGRPTVNQECYRRFKVGVMVPADPKIEVEEQLVDIGIAPHGLGECMSGAWEFNAYNPLPSIAQWFKPVTIKNAGNINLKNMKIGRYVNLYGSGNTRVSPIPGSEITSSLDDVAPDPGNPFLALKIPPFSTSGLGYTITKAQVGDADPTEMTIPDKRKWNLDFEGARSYAQTLYGLYADTVNALPEMTNSKILRDLNSPLPTLVSVMIPLSQPVGIYQSVDTTFNVPYVPVFSDNNNDQRLDAGEYYSQKSFQLKVTVKETQLTGGVTDSSLPHIDYGPDAKFGDATPAAFRDPVTGDVFLVWSSQRVVSPSALATLRTNNPEMLANAPWMLSYANLIWDPVVRAWRPPVQDPTRWWLSTPWADSTPNPYLPSFGWPSALLGSYANWDILEWAGAAGVPSVRHTSPVIAQYWDGNIPKAILAWVGTADITDPVTKKVAQEHRIFYTPADGGNVSSDATHIFAIEHDPAMVKRSPSIVMDGSKLWAFWQGGNDGRWSLYCSANPAPDDMTQWSMDMKLMLPDCLTAVSSPNAILRHNWAGQLFDVIYAGATKLSQTSDIMLTRYNAVNEQDRGGDASNPDLPSNKAHPMPRALGEKLERDTKYAFYTSKHIAWMRPAKSAALDNWGMYNMADSNPDLPYIRVVLPVGYKYKDSNGTDVFLTNETAISATDGSVWEYVKDTNSVWTWQSVASGTPITPTIDEGSGTYVYKYTAGSLADQVLGQMIADYSAGIIRITKALSEIKQPDEMGFLSANVYADYTPRTWRFTTDKATDNSPRAFIEKTSSMVKIDKDGNAVLDQNDNKTYYPVDRLWTFWRKAAPGAQSSTIYFSTYRIGVDLPDLFKRNGQTMVTDTKYRITGVESATGGNGCESWEIDGSGSKVYLRQDDEKYQTLAKSGLGTLPSPLIVRYQWKDSNGEIKDGKLPANDIFWVSELPEQSLLGFTADGNVNEGSIYAFADPVSGTLGPAMSSKIWLFWTSTRGGTSDLFWETVSPEFAAR